jgi:glycerate kinase
LCITAEGLLDRQSLRNKGPLGVAKRAAAHGVPVVALGGGIASDVTDQDFPTFAAMFSICSRPLSLEQAMRDAGPLLAAASERVVRLFARAHGQRRAKPRGLAAVAEWEAEHGASTLEELAAARRRLL